VGYFTLSTKGLILEANVTAAGLLGVARAALVKRALTHFIVREDQDIYYRHRKLLVETGAPQVCEFRMLRADATSFWVRVEASAAQNADGASVYRAMMSDITEKKEAELRNQKLNQALQEHLAALDAVNKELKSYSHTVSHELRTPLLFINKIAHLLLQEAGSLLSDKAVKQMNMILQATNEMGKLIENLLVFSQAGRKADTKTPHEPAATLSGGRERTQVRGRKARIEIVIGDLAPCEGDRTLLKEVAMILLGNAVKFTRRRDPARITIGCTRTKTETIHFVQDNGVGFNMGEADSLFVPFRRLHKLVDFEGVGIGLALARCIIERHGGRIWAEGEVDKGATFYFTLGAEAPGRTHAGARPRRLNDDFKD